MVIQLFFRLRHSIPRLLYFPVLLRICKRIILQGTVLGQPLLLGIKLLLLPCLLIAHLQLFDRKLLFRYFFLQILLIHIKQQCIRRNAVSQVYINLIDLQTADGIHSHLPVGCYHTFRLHHMAERPFFRLFRLHLRQTRSVNPL